MSTSSSYRGCFDLRFSRCWSQFGTVLVISSPSRLSGLRVFSKLRSWAVACQVSAGWYSSHSAVHVSTTISSWYSDYTSPSCHRHRCCSWPSVKYPSNNVTSCSVGLFSAVMRWSSHCRSRFQVSRLLRKLSLKVVWRLDGLWGLLEAWLWSRWTVIRSTHCRFWSIGLWWPSCTVRPCPTLGRVVSRCTFRKSRSLNSKCQILSRTACLSTLQDWRNTACLSGYTAVRSWRFWKHSCHRV